MPAPLRTHRRCRHCDKGGAVDKAALKQTIETLEKAQATILGTILNDVDFSKQGYGYGYGYSYGYGTEGDTSDS